jgi:hypothetical protein
VPDTKVLRPIIVLQVSRVVISRALAYLVGVRSHGNAKRPREPKISQLEVVVFINEEVLRFEISV